MDVVIAALLVLRQHPAVAQDDDLGRILVHADIFFLLQRVVDLVEDFLGLVLLDAPAAQTEALAVLRISLRFRDHIAIAVLLGDIDVGVGLPLPVGIGKGVVRLLGDVDGAVGLGVVGPAAHGGDGAVPLVDILAVLEQVVLMDVAVAQLARREHVGEGHAGRTIRGDLRVDLTAVAARQLKNLRHVVCGRDSIAPRREGDALIGAIRVFIAF